jgi:exonuclease VII small subunit
MNDRDTTKQLLEAQAKYDELLSEKEALTSDYNELYETYEAMYSDYTSSLEYVSQCETTIQQLNEVVDELDEQAKSLATSNEEYYQTIQQYEQREELFDKYEYAIERTNGTRTDITYEQLINLEELTAEKNVDTDLVLSICMVESNGIEDAKNPISTARGYGQFLASSGKYVYEDIMEAGVYDHSYALNGDTNFTMMVYYLDYLEDKFSGNLYKCIEFYRGRDGEILEDYMEKINSFLNNSSKSIASLNS